MKWRAYRAEICFHSALFLNIRSSCVPCFYKLGSLIFAKEKNLLRARSCGIKDQVRCCQFHELSGLLADAVASNRAGSIWLYE